MSEIITKRAQRTTRNQIKGQLLGKWKIVEQQVAYQYEGSICILKFMSKKERDHFMELNKRIFKPDSGYTPMKCLDCGHKWYEIEMIDDREEIPCPKCKSENTIYEE